MQPKDVKEFFQLVLEHSDPSRVLRKADGFVTSAMGMVLYYPAVWAPDAIVSSILEWVFLGVAVSGAWLIVDWRSFRSSSHH